MSLLPLLVIYIYRESENLITSYPLNKDLSDMNVQSLWTTSTVLRKTAEKDNVLKHGDASGLLQRFMMQFPKIAQCKQTQIWKQSSAGCLGHTGHHRGQWVTESARKTKLNQAGLTKSPPNSMQRSSAQQAHWLYTSWTRLLHLLWSKRCLTIS